MMGMHNNVTSSVPVNGIHGDEDGLSYSSTEQEASVHEGYMSQALNTSAQLNLSIGSDSMNVMRLQEQLRDSRRQLDRERNAKVSLENKRKNLEKERTELIQKLEDITRAKSTLEQNKIDLEAKIRSLQYTLSEELEKRKNTDVLYNKTKEQLSRKEEQYTQEVEAKQKAELSMRNLQMELKTSLATIKQLEEEKDDQQRAIQHERSSRQLQEQINEEQIRFQTALQEGKAPQQDQAQELAEAITKLEEADETRKQAVDTLEKMKAELYATKMEMERQRNRHKDEQGLLSSENEELQSKIDELKNDIRLNEEALAHASMQYNVQMSQMKTDNSVLTSTVDKERVAREKLEAEVESIRVRLEAANTELDKAQQARNELERTNHKEHEEWNKLLERRGSDLNEVKESNQNLSQKLTMAEAKVVAVENELSIANATLMERSGQLTTIQRDLDQRKTAFETLNEDYRKEKEESVRAQAKLETVQEKVSGLQHENLDLKKQVDELRVKDLGRDRGDSQDKFALMLQSLREDHEKSRSTLEDRNSMLNETVMRLRDEIRDMDGRRSSAEQESRHSTMEATEAQRKLSVAEASLEVAHRSKEQLEVERGNLKADIERLQTKLDSAKEKQMEAQARVAELVERLDREQQSKEATSQQLMNQSATAEAATKSKSELEAIIHRLELDNARMEAAFKHEQQKTDMLQKDLQDSNQVRQTMEQLLGNLKSANAHIEDKLTEAAAAKTVATYEAEDNRGLWETEVKARSKLGLRIAQLERQKQESLAQVEEERKKTRKAMELKKTADVKLASEQEKSSNLGNEVVALRAHLKAARKRLKELDTSDNHVNVMRSNFEREHIETERTLSTVRRQLEDVQSQLERETEQKDRLDLRSRQQNQELTSLRNMEKSFNKVDRAKKRLEEELAMYKSHVNSNFMDRTEVERMKAELEARSRLELNQKLEDVNNYLQEQADARERLDKMRESNDFEMRRDFEKTKKELMDELNKMRSSQTEMISSKENKEFEARKFEELYQSEVKLRERLADKLQHASDKANKAQMFLERQRLQPGVIENGWTGGGGGSPAFYPSKVPHGINDVLSHKIRSELDRSIHKHMEKAPQIDISVPHRSFDDTLLQSTFNRSATDYLDVLKKNYML